MDSFQDSLPVPELAAQLPVFRPAGRNNCPFFKEARLVRNAVSGEAPSRASMKRRHRTKKEPNINGILIGRLGQRAQVKTAKNNRE
jgi:hypothetical protein